MPQTLPIGSIRQPVDFNASPKTRFRESADNISRHRALVELREFERALDFAMLQFQRDVALETKDTNSALAAGWKLLGAQEFVKVLRTLSEQAAAPAILHNDNLNQQA